MKNISFKAVSILLIALLIFLLVSVPVSAQRTMDDVRKSVVQIVVLEAGTKVEFASIEGHPEWRKYLSGGSAFVIGVDEPFEYVATSAHVVSDPNDKRFNNADIYIWRSKDDYVSATIHFLLHEADIAVLKVDPNHLLYDYSPLELGRREIVKVNDAVSAVGFPALPDWYLNDFSSAYPEQATVTTGVVSRTVTIDGVAFIQMDTTVSWGNSGGPLVNQHGQVVGIVSRGIIPYGYNAASEIDYLTAALRFRGIPFMPAQDVVITDPTVQQGTPTDTDSTDITQPIDDNFPTGFDTTTGQVNYLALGLGLLALFVVLAALFIAMRGRKAAVATIPQQSMIPMTQSLTSSAAGPVTMTRGEMTPSVTQAGPKELGPMLRGIAGYFVGQNIELIDNHLVIGRDPRLSQLVYPREVDKISRKHLSIRYDEKMDKFVLVDSSTNGTFLSSKQKLQPGDQCYLNSGDRFYLAEPSEVFEVRVEK